MPNGGTAHLISSTGFTLSNPSAVIPIRRLWVELAFQCRAGNRLFRKCLLDTGAALCVVPYAIHSSRNLDWQPLPGLWPPNLTTWMGVPCSVGQIQARVPLPGVPFLRGPLVFLAKFAQATPAGITDALPILLELNFLAHYLAVTSFQCHALPKAGDVLLP